MLYGPILLTSFISTTYRRDVSTAREMSVCPDEH